MSIYLRRAVASFLIIGLALQVSFEILAGRSLRLPSALILPLFAFPYLCMALPAFFTRRSVTLGSLLAALLVLLSFDLFHWHDWASPAPEASIGNGVVWLFECGFGVVATLLAFLLGVVVPPTPPAPNGAIQRAGIGGAGLRRTIPAAAHHLLKP